MTVSAEGAGAAVTISKKDASMTSQRRLRTALAEPAYDLELVPSAARDLAGSALVRVEGTASWERLIGEMLLLCNEASWRYVSAERARPGPRRLELAPTEPKPLMLEYISDRVDTDEPLWGYVARTSAEGWMQGFVCVTQFTTWQPYFRWTSGAPSAGVTADDVASHAVDGRAPTLDAAASVGAGAVSLTRELQCARRGGDPEGEGVVWPRVAEVSLLGGLGCGTTLLNLVLDELDASGACDFVVLQATDNAVPFYERNGFSRVGAVASFEQRAEALPAFVSDPAYEFRGLGARVYWARRLGRALLRALAALDDQLIFSYPVDTVAIPMYLAWIERPMDFSTMRKKLVDGAAPLELADAYLPDDLVADFELVLANCMYFNGKGSWLCDYAKAIRRKAAKVIDHYRTYARLWGLRELYGDGGLDVDAETRAFHAAADGDPAVMGYVHWTFPDQTVEDQYPSYIMARRVRGPGAAPASALLAAADAAPVSYTHLTLPTKRIV